VRWYDVLFLALPLCACFECQNLFDIITIDMSHSTEGICSALSTDVAASSAATVKTMEVASSATEHFGNLEVGMLIPNVIPTRWELWREKQEQKEWEEKMQRWRKQDEESEQEQKHEQTLKWEQEHEQKLTRKQKLKLKRQQKQELKQKQKLKRIAKRNHYKKKQELTQKLKETMRRAEESWQKLVLFENNHVNNSRSLHGPV
jgi:HrpA-like RNA helicase